MRSKHATSPADVMVYGNGPVLVSPKVYLIFWGYQKYGDPDGLMPLLERYIGNMGGSGHNNIYTQYYEMSGSTKTYVTNPTSQLGGVWMDNNHEPYSPTDAQIAQQAIDSIATFGYDPNGSYVVATPSGRNSNGFWHQYCAYHGAVYYNSNYISYTNFPYQPDAGSFCGSDFLKVRPRDEKALDEGVTIIEGHEEGESATDPVPGSGWVDGYGNEIGDVCAWEDIANDPFGRYSFTMQPMFSNATGTCVQSY